MKIITQAKAIEIITIHGNLNEFYYFIKELGNKKEYKLKDLKELRDNGVLTDEEFVKAKKKLLE